MSSFEEEIPTSTEAAPATYPLAAEDDGTNKRDRDEGFEAAVVVDEPLKKAKTGAGTSTTAVGSDGQTLVILEVAPDKVGQIIGSKGMVIMDIQTRSGARAYVNQDFPDGVNRQVNITGTAEQAQMAKELIELIVSQGPTAIHINSMAGGPQITEVVECNQPQVGKIIGTGGATIKELQSKSGARIQIDQNFPPDQPRKINITGTGAAVATAVQLINSVMNGGPALLGMGMGGGMYGGGGMGMMGGQMGGMGATSQGSMQTFGGDAKQTMEVPKAVVGKIIGRGGETITLVQSKSGARVQVDQSVPEGTPCKVAISGTPQAVANAVQLLNDVLAGVPSARLGENMNMGGGMGMGGDEDEGVLSAAVERLLAEDDAVVGKLALLARAWHTYADPTATATPPLSGPTQGAAVARQRVVDAHLHLSTPLSTLRTLSTSPVSSATAKTAAVLRQLFPGTTPVPDVSLLFDLDEMAHNLHALHHSFDCAFYGSSDYCGSTGSTGSTGFGTSSNNNSISIVGGKIVHPPSPISHAERTGVSFLHCYAMKCAPLSYLLHRAVAAGCGLEVASLMELKQALRCGCPPAKIVFDSPCKSDSDLQFALRHGVMVNANSIREVGRIDAQLGALREVGIVSQSVVGLRINPLVSAGAISALSTGTSTSKFGVAVVDPEGVLAVFKQYPFLSGLMCHVGSQGMALDTMLDAAVRTFKLADAIDAQAGGPGARISHIDVGGGLTANLLSDEVVPSFAAYANPLAEVWQSCLSEALTGRAKRVLVTEFGKALVAKCGTIAARVEDVFPMASADLETMVVMQAGADLLLRTCYAPVHFQHRMQMLDAAKQPITVAPTPTTAPTNAPQLNKFGWEVPGGVAARAQGCVTLGGPLCFSGDILGRQMPLPTPAPGDVCVILDAGANTISLHSRHCSRPAPQVFAFRSAGALLEPAFPTTPTTTTPADSYIVACVKDAETDQQLLQFWG